MRRAAELYLLTRGPPRPTPEDAYVLADYAMRNADRLNWVSLDDELLANLQILNGRDIDLAADATRVANRLRDALLSVSPALERAVGDRLTSNGGVRDALVSCSVNSCEIFVHSFEDLFCCFVPFEWSRVFVPIVDPVLYRVL